MWELIKNDPILKTISVLIIGMFAFAFAFSVMFGSGQSNMEHSMSSGGYDLANSLGYVVTLLSKILIIVLLVAVIITAIKFIQKHVIANEPIKFADILKKQSLTFKNKSLASILVAIGGILIVLLLVSMVLPRGNSAMMYGTTYYGMANSGFGVTGLLIAILHIIAFVSFAGLILGLVMYFKERYTTVQKTVVASAKVQCSQCGNELKDNWKCCPGCGLEIKEEVKETTKDNEEN